MADLSVPVGAAPPDADATVSPGADDISVAWSASATADSRRTSFIGLLLSKMAANPYSQVMGPYLTLVVMRRASSAVAITFALTAHRLLGAVTYPLAGRLSDRTTSRFGRRVPYMAGGLLLAAAGVWFLPDVRSYAGLVVVIVAARQATMLQRVARFSVTPDVFGRSRWIRAALTIALTGVIPGAITLAVIRFTWHQDQPGTWRLTFRLAAVGLALAAVAVLALVREAPASRKAAEVAKSRSWREELQRFLSEHNSRVLLVGAALTAAAGASTARLVTVWAAERLGVGGPQLVNVSVATGIGSLLMIPVGVWLSGRVHPRRLAVLAATFAGLVTLSHVFISTVTMWVIASVALIPLTVAAVVACIPLFLHLVPESDSVGETFGVIAGPLAALTALGGYASAALVDVTGDYRTIWLVAGTCILLSALAWGRLEVPVGEERTDIRAVIRRVRSRRSSGLFDGEVEDVDVIAGEVFATR